MSTIYRHLIDLIKNGENNTFIKKFEDSGLDVNSSNLNCRSILSYATEYDNLEVIKFLVQKGADITIIDYYGSLLLHTATKYGNIKCVEFFLNSGIHINSRDYRDCTPLHYLCEETHIAVENMERRLELARFLIAKKTDLNSVNINGSTPVLLAAQNLQEHMVKLFLQLGANATVCDNCGWTLLHYCCRNGWSEIVQSLVEGTRDNYVNVKTFKEYTPIIIAANSFRKEVVKLLIELGANLEAKAYKNRTILHYACRHGWLDIVKSLVNKCDLNTVDFDKYTPMLHAAQNSHLSVVEFLLKSGANYECWDEDDWTILHFACKYAWLSLLKFLVIEKGFTGIKSTSAYKALNFTAESSHGGVDSVSHEERVSFSDSRFRKMRFPIRKGAAINFKFSIGDSPLLVAAKAANHGVVKMLIASGASVDCCPQGEWTLLHYVCKEGWLDITETLVIMTKDLNNSSNIARETPLHVAVHHRELAIVEYLLKVGADYNVENRFGFTAFQKLIRSPICLQGIALFLENGAYFNHNEYAAISEVPSLKQGILQDVKLCSYSIINKFNTDDLPQFYELGNALKLPSIQKLHIDGNSHIAQDIILSVEYDIKSNGYCNMPNVQLIVLSILCVKCLIDYYRR